VFDVQAVTLVQMLQQLQCIPNVLGWGLRRSRARGRGATIERAAALGTAPQVDDTAAIDGNSRQDHAARHRATVDPTATIGEEATGHGHDIICRQWRAGATRRTVV